MGLQRVGHDLATQQQQRHRLLSQGDLGPAPRAKRSSFLKKKCEDHQPKGAYTGPGVRVRRAIEKIVQHLCMYVCMYVYINNDYFYNMHRH